MKGRKQDVGYTALFASLVTTGILTLSPLPAWALSPPQIITTSVDAYSPQPVATFQPGDKVKIEYQLMSSDPGEDAEGENFNMQFSSTGALQTLNVLHLYSAYETDVQLIPTNTNPPTLQAWFSGADGDEGANLTIFINEADPLHKTQSDIDHWEQLAESYHHGSDAANVAKLLCPPVEWCPTLIESFGSGADTLGMYYETLAQDPPDNNYTVIAQPITPTGPTLAPANGEPASVLNSANALLQVMREEVGLQEAMLTSLNRASSAHAAGATAWETKQRSAALEYGLQLALDSETEVQARSTFIAAWNAAGLPTLSITPNQVYDYEYGVYYNGLSPSYVQTLTAIGLSPTEIDHLRALAIVQDPTAVANAGPFPQGLTRPTLLKNLAGAQSALVDVALENGTPLPAGTQATGEGVVTDTTGARVTFAFQADNGHGDDGPKGGSLVLQGHLVLKDHGTGFTIQHSHVTTALRAGSFVVLSGSYEAQDGSTGTFNLAARPGTEEGRPGAVVIQLSNGYSVVAPLTQGHIDLNLQGEGKED